MSSAQGDIVADIAIAHAPCSARDADTSLYADLILRPSEAATTAQRAYYLANPSLSTCALTVLGCWRLAGLPDPEVQGPYYPARVGRAFADMEAVASRHGAWEAGPPRGPLQRGDVWIITAPDGTDGHTGLVTADQALVTDPLATVEGGQFDGKGSTAVRAFSRALRWDGAGVGLRCWMGQRVIYGVIRAAGLPIPVLAAPLTPDAGAAT